MVAEVVVTWRKHGGVRRKVVGALGVFEAVLVRRLKWLLWGFFRRRCGDYGEGCSIVLSMVRVSGEMSVGEWRAV